jgi:NAD(P)-dependent dehydrogenase (short-subunit alcohol dehydrogenase family)
MKLDKKVAVVTGGTSGMGKAIVQLFSQEGAAVVFNGRNNSAAESICDDIFQREGTVSYLCGDIRSPNTNETLIRKAVEQFGGVDILIAAAGMLGLGSVTNVEEETWHRTIDTNLNAIYYLMRFGIPELGKRGGGSIVAISSIAGFKGFPNHPAYCASKGGLNALVKQAAIDYSPAIRINALCPGPVDTPLIWRSAKAFPDPSKAVSDVAEKNPMKRLGTPEDIASAALFLASEDSSWITGSLVTIDGGISCL